MRWVLVIGLLMLYSCGRRDSVPSGVFSPQKMERVLTDVLLAESFAESYLLIDTTRTRDASFTGELNKVLVIQKISEADFRRSLEFYKSRPDIFKVVIDSVNARAQRNRDHIYDEQKKKRLKVE